MTRTATTLCMLASLLCGLWPAAGQAQTSDCPSAAQTSAQHLYGLWSAQIAPGNAQRTGGTQNPAPPGGAAAGEATSESNRQGFTVLLERSREFVDGLSGAINRGGVKSFIAGDVDEGVFSIEESADGRNIDAIWQGHVVEGSCARLITGHWRRAGTTEQRPFELRRHSGW